MSEQPKDETYAELKRKRDEYDHKAATCMRLAAVVFVVGMAAVCVMALLGI